MAMTQVANLGEGTSARQTQGGSSVKSAGVGGASTGGKGASVWPGQAPHSGVEGTAALELAAGLSGEHGLLGALLELVGAEHLTLGHTLAAWQREQDRLANRAWRRPGGLARPAGL
jgi:hypothetical protein